MDMDLADILLESGLISTGSLHGVLSGKHYDHALHCHKTLLECLERLLLRSYLETGDENHFPSLSAETINNITNARGPSTHEFNGLEDSGLVSYLAEYEQRREDMWNGQHGKTAQFWMSYMDHVWLVLELLYAVKTNNLSY